MPEAEDVQRSLGRIEGQLSEILRGVQCTQLELKAHAIADDSRFSAIERKLYWLVGASTTAASAATFAATWLFRH